MLRKIRIGISLTIFLLLTFYLVDFAGILPNSFHVLAHMQLIPALLGLNLGILLFLLVLTWLTGRSYCSVICPLGIFQDIAIWISRKRDKKKHYDYRRALNRWRWGILLLIVVAGFSGFMFLVSLFDPYSAYGRIVVNVLKPLYLVVNNFLTWIFTMFDNYTFYYMDIIVTSVSALIIAFVTLLVVGYLAYRYGRIYCNTVCPVGTLLGFISKYSLFKVHIDTSKCNSCGLCARKCKASCIDSKKHEIDYSRCVVCFDCIDNCRQGAISYTLRYKKESQKNISSDEPDISKRTFVATLTAVALTAGAPLVQAILDVLPSWVTGGLSVAGKLLPGLGIAMLLHYMPAKKYFNYILIGFVLSAYMGVPILGIAFLGVALAYKFYMDEEAKENVGFAGGLEDE